MPRLTGRRIVLREYRDDDFAAIRAWVNDGEATANLLMGSHGAHSEAVTRAFLETAMKREGDTVFFVVGDRSTSEYLGQIDLRVEGGPARQASLGIVIPDPANRGRGIGREAIALLLDFAFDVRNMHRVWLHVFARNEGAIRAYTRVGFREEGRLRDDQFYRGRYEDALVMGILEDEWIAGRAQVWDAIPTS